MLLGFVDFLNFAQGFNFASRKAISEASEFFEIYQMGFGKGCDTGGVLIAKKVNLLVWTGDDYKECMKSSKSFVHIVISLFKSGG